MNELLADEQRAILQSMQEKVTPQSPVTPVEQPKEPVQPPVENTTPPAEQPKETAAEPVKTVPPVEHVSNDEVRLRDINEIWGTSFKSLDEFKQAKSEFDQLGHLKEVKNKYEELSKTPLPKFANDRIKEENNFLVATGLDDASILKDIRRFEASVEKDPIDALVIQAILKKPELAESKAMLRKMIAQDFRIDVKQTDEHGEPLTPEAMQAEKERVEIEQFKLRTRAMDAEKDIKETMDKFKNYVPQEEPQSKGADTKAQWEGELNKLSDVFKTIPVQVSLGKDKEGNETFETIDSIELTPQEQKGCLDRAINFALANNLPLTEDNLVYAVSHQIQMVQAANLTRIVSKVRESQESKVRKELELSIHNPSSLQIPTPEAKDDGKLTADKLLAAQMEHLGG